ncbi:MAG: helix-turn-helix domain-containing protein, partial [Desulfobulbaceae bacterium]|nr:helix-turn-helix domain-containing protein [Desulfobulbaceae bacterium]
NYLLEVCRYTVLNPVRAGMVAKAGDWTWSSFPATSGMVDAPAWLEVEQLLTLFGRNQQLAQAAYRSFVRQVVASPPLWDALQGQIYLGDQRFVRRLQAMAGTDHQLSEIPRLQRTPPPKPLAHFSECYPDRRRAMAEAFHSGQYTMKEIAHFHGVHYSTVSRWIKHFEQEPAAVD